MTLPVRLLVAAASSVIGVPLIMVAISPLAWIWMEPSPAPVSPEEVPGLFPVLGFWRDSAGGHCSAFLYRELAKNAGQLPDLSYGASNADLDICSRSFETYNATGTWPDSFPWTRGLVGQDQIAHFEVKPLDAATIEVHVSYGLSDGPNDSWYEVREGSSLFHNPRYQRYFGPSVMPALFLVSVSVSLGVYVVLATIWVFRRRRDVTQALG